MEYTANVILRSVCIYSVHMCVRSMGYNAHPSLFPRRNMLRRNGGTEAHSVQLGTWADGVGIIYIAQTWILSSTVRIYKALAIGSGV